MLRSIQIQPYPPVASKRPGGILTSIFTKRKLPSRKSSLRQGSHVKFKPGGIEYIYSYPFASGENFDLSSSSESSSVSSDIEENYNKLKSEGDALIPIPSESEEDTTETPSKDRILQKIREKKDVIEKLRSQPWAMHRKIKTLRLAQKYLEKHEATVSRSHLAKEELSRQWKKFKRWCVNMSIYLIPWEARIKTIESHFGSVVSSYFTFLRWIFWVNLVMSVFMLVFIVVPETLADAGASPNRTARLSARKDLAGDMAITATEIQNIWEFEGVLRVSPLFYGFYGDDDTIGSFKYQLPLAYFLVYLVVLGYSFFAILRKMAENARRSKMAAGKAEHYTFSWKMFTGWDYTIGATETASNTVMANANKIKETIVEYRAKQKQGFSWILIFGRLTSNIVILSMVAASAFIVYYVVQDSRDNTKFSSAFQKNKVPITVSMITLFFPNIFEQVARLEKYHPRTGLRLHLARILLLYLLNFYTLMFALFSKMEEISKEQDRVASNFIAEVANTTSASISPETIERVARALANLSNLDQSNSTLLSQLVNSIVSSSALDAGNVSTSILIAAQHVTAPALASPTANLAQTLGSILPSTGSALSSIAAITTSVPTTAIPLLHLLVGNNSRNSPPNAARKPAYLPSMARLRFSAWNALRRKREQPAVSSHIRDAKLRDLLLQTTTFSTMGPFNWTRFVPPFGKVGVQNAHAYLWENLPPELQRQLSGVEFATKPGITVVTLPPDDLRPPTIRPFRNRTRTTTLGPSQNATDAFNGTSPIWAVPWGHPGTYSSLLPEEPPETTTTTEEPPTVPPVDISQSRKDLWTASSLTHLCWETYMGQEVCRLVTMDLMMTLTAIFVIDFVRGLIVRFCNRWWCWNLETQFPEYGEFKVAENVLHIVNNQGMIWLGLFFSPLLPALNNVKLVIIMYTRSWACSVCNVPATNVFRASRSNNFYLVLLLLMLFLCTLPVGFMIASQRPSRICGPFTGYDRFFSIITRKIRDTLPAPIYNTLNYIASPGIVIPLFVLLLLVIYFLGALARALRESNEDLKSQLHTERTEEKRKIYAMAGGGKNERHQEPGGPTMPEGKKVDLSHLPLKEKTRREPWRSRPPLLSEGRSATPGSDRSLGLPDIGSESETGSEASETGGPSDAKATLKPPTIILPSLPMHGSTTFVTQLPLLAEETEEPEPETGSCSSEDTKSFSRMFPEEEGNLRQIETPTSSRTLTALDTSRTSLAATPARASTSSAKSDDSDTELKQVDKDPMAASLTSEDLQKMVAPMRAIRHALDDAMRLVGPGSDSEASQAPLIKPGDSSAPTSDADFTPRATDTTSDGGTTAPEQPHAKRKKITTTFSPWPEPPPLPDAEALPPIKPILKRTDPTRQQKGRRGNSPEHDDTYSPSRRPKIRITVSSESDSSPERRPYIIRQSLVGMSGSLYEVPDSSYRIDNYPGVRSSSESDFLSSTSTTPLIRSRPAQPSTSGRNSNNRSQAEANKKRKPAALHESMV